jgi:hypothetical protein
MEDQMKPWIAGVALVLGYLGVLVVTVQNPPDTFPEAEVLRPAPALPTEVGALSGVWEGVGPKALPTRLVVEDLHENWANVLYTWGDEPDGKFQKGWLRVRAKVLPGGKLFWRHPGNFTFQLSEDQTMLVCTREQAGATATSLLRRVPSDVALTALASGEHD